MASKEYNEEIQLESVITQITGQHKNYDFYLR